MKTSPKESRIRAFTLFELIIVVALLLILTALFPVSLTSSKSRALRISCVNNLRQDALAFHMWAENHGNRFPMEVSTTNSGSMEFVGGPETFRHFQVMSNELNTPKVLYCPTESDRFRTMANVFDPTATSGTPTVPFVSNSNLCYFVGLDAVQTNATMFLAGDHNLTDGTLKGSGVLALTTNRLASWTDEMHKRQGNVALADGSVQMFTTKAVQNALGFTGAVTNRLSMP